MKIRIWIVAFLSLWIFQLSAQEIDVNHLKKIIYTLASDSLKGRKPGTIEDMLTSNYIRKEFRDAGLKLMFLNGFQVFNVTTDVSLGKLNELFINNKPMKVKEDFTPLAFSENNRMEAPVVFAGYGFDINLDSLKWNDYQGLDVKGKWVMILKGDPEFDKSVSQFIPFTDDRSKILTAKDKGAAGVLLVAGTAVDKKDSIGGLVYDKSDARCGIMALQITRKLANQVLNEGKTIENLEKQLNESRKPLSFAIGGSQVKATTQVMMNEARTQNIVGMIEGSDSLLKKEYIVVGAHYDHLGMGGPGSGSRLIDTIGIHHGADDNASGVAGIIALAKKINQSKEKPKRSLIFVAFTGEEMGLLGSKHFVKNPPVPLKSIKAMLNLDMVGRLKPDSGSVVVSGTGTSAEAESILDKYKNGRIFQVKYSPEGYGASDHSSFYIEDIPVFFFTTGAHEDYHTPSDVASKIDYNGEKAVLDFAYDILTDVANLSKDLTFKEAGPKSGGRTGQRFKVTLGILPDFTSSGNEGLRIDGARKDGPAARGGMLKGDVITAINGKPVKNIYEYMDRLKTLEAGKTCNVDVMRNGKLIVFLIQL